MIDSSVKLPKDISEWEEPLLKGDVEAFNAKAAAWKDKYPNERLNLNRLNICDNEEKGELKGIDFSNTDLIKAKISNNNFENADFRGANIFDSDLNLAYTNFKNIKIDDKTIIFPINNAATNYVSEELVNFARAQEMFFAEKGDLLQNLDIAKQAAVFQELWSAEVKSNGEYAKLVNDVNNAGKPPKSLVSAHGTEEAKQQLDELLKEIVGSNSFVPSKYKTVGNVSSLDGGLIQVSHGIEITDAVDDIEKTRTALIDELIKRDVKPDDAEMMISEMYESKAHNANQDNSYVDTVMSMRQENKPKAAIRVSLSALEVLTDYEISESEKLESGEELQK